MGVWVDTDFGFDDLWAILVLRAEGIVIDGISLVAGNAVLEQVVRNATGAQSVFGADWQLYQGAANPLHRPQETAERILGAKGMQSRGRYLPTVLDQSLPPVAPALRDWLSNGQTRHDVLALGPLTNLAQMYGDAPQDFAKISRIIWMGGASGRGNHSPHAEFNALADPEAVAHVFSSGVQVDVVDLEICRKVTFGTGSLPTDLTPLLADLLGGYLDIALSRGRQEMAIYDPLAALSLACPESVGFAPVHAEVELTPHEKYGKTTFSPAEDSSVSLATRVVSTAADRCLSALRKASND